MVALRIQAWSNIIRLHRDSMGSKYSEFGHNRFGEREEEDTSRAYLWRNDHSTSETATEPRVYHGLSGDEHDEVYPEPAWPSPNSSPRHSSPVPLAEQHETLRTEEGDGSVLETSAHVVQSTLVEES